MGRRGLARRTAADRCRGLRREALRSKVKTILKETPATELRNVTLGRYASDRYKMYNAKQTARQTFEHVENYFTEDVWTMLIDGSSSKYQHYMGIARLLVLLGLYRPALGFWFTLLDTL